MKYGKLAVSGSGLLALALLCAGPADAQMRRPFPSYTYAFGEYDYYSASGGSLNGGGLGLGWRFNRYFGVEGGGQFATKSGVDVKVGYAQALFIMPFSSQFDVTLSAGAAYLDASTKVLGTSVSANSTGYRAGLGVDYYLTPAWTLRFGVHRQNAGGVADDISAGIAYRF